MSLLTVLAASPAAIPSDWRAGLPQPLLPSQPGWVEFYYDAWRIADQQAQRVPLGWHFSNAFNPDVIYQWDEVWISTFAKYVQGAHPNVTNPMAGIDQVYAAQKGDGYITYKWHGFNGTGKVQGPIFSFGELSYYNHVGDIGRLKTALPILDDFFFYVKRTLSTDIGPYEMSYCGNGMDNRPHGELIIDLTAQQAMNAFLLAEMAQRVGDHPRQTKFEAEYAALKETINTLLWIPEDSFYGDLNITGRAHPAHVNAWTAGGFWPLMSGVPGDEQVAGLVNALNDTGNFRTPHMVPSLGQRSYGYSRTGNYWRGSVWTPTTTICIKGLARHGYAAFAAEIARNDLDAAYKVWRSSGTIFENYWQEDDSGHVPLTSAQHDFVGWSGVTPIATLIEHVIGVQTNAPQGRIVWAATLAEEHGVRNLRWGAGAWNHSVDLLMTAADAALGTRTIQVNSTSAFELEVAFPPSNESHVFGVKAASGQVFVTSAPRVPTPAPTAPQPATSFTKHDKSYCGTAGTDAAKAMDRNGVALAGCQALCAADVACLCFEYLNYRCKTYHGQAAVRKSGKGWDCFTRDSATNVITP